MTKNQKGTKKTINKTIYQKSSFFHTQQLEEAIPMDGIIGWFFSISSLGDVVADASQGRFLFFVLRHLAQKGHIWSTKVISGPDLLKKSRYVFRFLQSCLVSRTMMADFSLRSLLNRLKRNVSPMFRSAHEGNLIGK